MLIESFTVLALAAIQSHALPTQQAEEAAHEFDKRALPFTQVVGFGDDFNDNSQGSYAHGITGGTTSGENKQLWGYGTWTDGPISMTYMAQSLGLPIKYDYSFGSSGGGEKVGSVCNNALIPSNYASNYAMYNGKIVPDALSQISNYTSNAGTKANIAKTLHVLWTGNNDMTPYIRFYLCTDGSCNSGQQQFLSQLNQCQTTALTNLIKAGAKYILVPDIYPKQLAPLTTQYITQDAGQIANYKALINSANANLQKTINALNKQYGTQIKYFQANSLITGGYNAPRSAGISAGAGGATAPGYVNTCVDGCSVQGPANTSNFNLWYQNTVIGKKVDDFYWMTSVMPTTTVLKTLAGWMVNTVKTMT